MEDNRLIVSNTDELQVQLEVGEKKDNHCGHWQSLA
jgi:hypothetical protein